VYRSAQVPVVVREVKEKPAKNGKPIRDERNNEQTGIMGSWLPIQQHCVRDAAWRWGRDLWRRRRSRTMTSHQSGLQEGAALDAQDAKGYSIATDRNLLLDNWSMFRRCSFCCTIRVCEETLLTRVVEADDEAPSRMPESSYEGSLFQGN
jgi:hypothetical protein